MTLSITSTNEWSIVGRLDFPPRHLFCSVTHGMGKKLLVANDLGGSCTVTRVLVVDNTGNDFIVRQYFKARVIDITFEPVLNAFLVAFFKS
ncbi:hypothetical protein AVEN_120837-1 [Araneus ventricosus]|uniref:Uncharacterized protein n=1 Tax=Araneus ventricosus TaxID=182803 RepID=A0A4Y2Q5B7_ARAVE|nr:hypothetical protein AVEN_120837-1 [Araneus ventricosus]